MGKMLDQFNSKLENLANKDEREIVKSAVRFDKYDRAKKDNSTIDVTFDVATEDGNLIFIDENGVKVILYEEIFSSSASYYKPSIRSKFIGIKISVKVYEIDKDNDIVLVKSARVGTANSDVAKVAAEIRNALGKGEQPLVYGTVDFVNRTRAFVKICGLNLSGMVSVADWSKGYTRFLNEHCEKGSIYPFSVTGIKTNRADQERRGQIFILSHKQFTVDPWKALDSTLIQIGSVLYVKCVEIPTGKTYWWGTSKIAPGIEIIGNFNSKLIISKGAVYKCKVRKYNDNQRQLQVSPFEVTDNVTIDAEPQKNREEQA